MLPLAGEPWIGRSDCAIRGFFYDSGIVRIAETATQGSGPDVIGRL